LVSSRGKLLGGPSMMSALMLTLFFFSFEIYGHDLSAMGSIICCEIKVFCFRFFDLFLMILVTIVISLGDDDSEPGLISFTILLFDFLLTIILVLIQILRNSKDVSRPLLMTLDCRLNF